MTIGNLWKRLATVGNYTWPILLPPGAAALSAIAAVNQGLARFYWAATAVFVILVQAIVGVVKEVRKSKGESTFEARKRAVQERLAEASRPLVLALCRVSSGADPLRRQAEVNTLVLAAVATARAECGSGTRSNYRSSFYSLRGDRLERVAFDGRPGHREPRRLFDPQDALDLRQLDAALAVRTARGDNMLFVDDLHEKPPPSITNPEGRSYRTMLAVPVNADGRHFGLFAIDSPDQKSLSDVDQKYILLIAGMIAACLAQLSRDGYVIAQDGHFVSQAEEDE